MGTFTCFKYLGWVNKWISKWCFTDIPRYDLDFLPCIILRRRSLSVYLKICPTLCDPMECSTPGFPVHHQLPELAQTHVHRVVDAIQPSHSPSSPSPPTLTFPNIRVFSSESVLCIIWPKYWNFSFSISPSNEHLGLISFRINWLSPCSPRNSQESSPTPQFRSIYSWVLNCLYGPTLTSLHDHWKAIALTRQTFVGKPMSLLFNVLSGWS